MTKRSKSGKSLTTAKKPSAGVPKESDAALVPDDQITFSRLSLHELFEQQARDILDRSDLDEEQKQNVLVALSCPCCGGGAFSYTAKIRRRS